MPDKLLRVGIIGFGFIGKVHAYAHESLPYYYPKLETRTQITHVCTSRAETAQAARELTGAEHACTDFRRVTDDPEVDLVHICTPNHLHADALAAAMARGKHIYCDKPLTADWDEAQAVAEAAKSYRGKLQMTLQNRFFPATLRAADLVREGALGRVLTFRAAYLHSGSANPDAPLKWKLDAAAGGGVIADLGTHVLDLVHQLVGDFSEMQSASTVAFAERPTPQDAAVKAPVQAEDGAMLLLRTGEGALGVVEATKIATGTEDELRFEIHGERGALRFNSMQPHHLEHYAMDAPDHPHGGHRGWTRIDCGQRYGAPAAAWPSPKFSIGWIRTHVACLAAFIEAIEDGRRPTPGLGQGLYLQYLIQQAREGAKDRAWRTLKPKAALLRELGV